MTPVTIRYSIMLRVQGVILCLVPAAAIVFFILISSHFTDLLSLPFPLSLLGIGMGLFMLVIVLVFLLGLGLLAIRAAQYLFFRMEFLENSFRIYSFSWSGKKVADYPFTDVLRVGRGPFRGTVDIQLAGANPLRLTPLLYEAKGEKLFSELEQRFPPEKVERNLKDSVLNFKGWDFLTYPILIGMLAGVLLLAWQSAGLDIFRSNATWAYAAPRNFEFSYKAVSTEEDGTVWFGASSLFSKNAQISRLQDGSLQTWDVPLSAFASGDNAYDIIGVAGTADEKPAWITEKYFATWTGTEWARTPLPMEILNYLGFSIAGHSLQYVSAKGSEYRLISCDLTLRICHSLEAPGSLEKSGTYAMLYRGSASGPVVAAGTTKGPVSFLRFQEGTWSEIAGPLRIPAHTLMAFTVAGDGTLWVIKDLSGGPLDGGFTKGPLAFGRWDAAAGEWRWINMAAFAKSYEMDPENMEVDPLGRIWIAGHFRTKEILIGETASAYAINGGQAEEIVQYTDDNSNFQMGIGDCPMVQGANGTLWSCEIDLISLDAAAEKLPDPVVKSSVDVSALKYRMLGLGVVCLMELAYFAILAVIYLLRKKAQTPGR
jgi:hypothetical protein